MGACIGIKDGSIDEDEEGEGEGIELRGEAEKGAKAVIVVVVVDVGVDVCPLLIPDPLISNGVCCCGIVCPSKG